MGRLRCRGCDAPHSLELVGKDRTEEWVMRSDSRVCQRDDEYFFSFVPMVAELSRAHLETIWSGAL